MFSLNLKTKPRAQKKVARNRSLSAASASEMTTRVAITDNGITANAGAAFAAFSSDFPAADLQRFAHLSRDAMAVADTGGMILRINDGFTKHLGYEMADLMAMDIISLFHHDDRPHVQRTLQSMNDEDTAPADFEARMMARTGSERWMECRLAQNNGQVYLLGHDVTAIKRQEKALLRRAAQLKEAESLGRMGHWRWQIGEEAIDWSDELYRIFGVTREDFKPTLASMNAMINRRDIAKVNQAFQRAMMEQNDYDMEFRIKGPNGEERFIRCEGRCAVNTDGEAIALFGIMQDMTERMLHEKDMREAKDAAERAYAAKSQFLANMSHELRTPLNAVIGFSEIMHKQLLGPIGTEKYLEYVKGILDSGEHLLDMIGDILDMSKIEAGKYELLLEEVNVLKTVRLAVHMMESRAVDQDVKISVTATGDENALIIADRRAFLQVVLNLLSNAVKFSKPRTRVEVGLASAGGITLKIVDHGIGIPAHKLASITRPFEQVQSHYTREHEGTGLGLAITKELIEMHGGTIQIESKLGEGTTVTVKMPADASKAKKR